MPECYPVTKRTVLVPAFCIIFQTAVRKGNAVSYITFENVTKEYHTGGETVLAANNVCFEMEKGELSVVARPPSSTFWEAWTG